MKALELITKIDELESEIFKAEKGLTADECSILINQLNNIKNYLQIIRIIKNENNENRIYHQDSRKQRIHIG